MTPSQLSVRFSTRFSSWVYDGRKQELKRDMRNGKQRPGDEDFDAANACILLGKGAHVDANKILRFWIPASNANSCANSYPKDIFLEQKLSDFVYSVTYRTGAQQFPSQCLLRNRSLPTRQPFNLHFQRITTNIARNLGRGNQIRLVSRRPSTWLALRYYIHRIDYFLHTSRPRG